MTDWTRVLRAMSPRGKSAIITGFANALPGMIDEFELSTPLRQAHFLAQCAHESDGFNAVEEYASGRAYEGRKDLGNTKAGDGPRYKGRGPIQLTGRANYRKFGGALGIDLEGEPELAAEFPIAARTAGLYWKLHNLNRLADANDIRGITRAINGGYNGLDDRIRYFGLAQRALVANAAPASPYGRLARVGFMSAEDDEAAPPAEGDVKAAQERLKGLGYFPGFIDGNPGGQTRGALTAFQTDNGLPITGELDPATQATLGSAMARSRPIADARRDATVDDLRDDGSRTIAAADDAEDGAGAMTKLVGGVGAAASLTGVTNAISTANTVKDSASTLPTLWGWLWTNWPLALLIVVVAIVWWKGRDIKKAAQRVRLARLDDHHTFKNAGR